MSKLLFCKKYKLLNTCSFGYCVYFSLAALSYVFYCVASRLRIFLFLEVFTMDKGIMEKFLVQCTVPVKKNDDRIYDCVWRAHRDVLAGRFYLIKYQNVSHDMVNYLCKAINNSKKPLSSNSLIQKLKGKYEIVEFGAIQKLVNMSLKYLLVLNKYEGHIINIDEKYCDCPLDSTILDCLAEDVKKLKKQKINEQNKINEDILNALEEKEIKWTSIKKEQYDDVQKIIDVLTKDKGSKLAYDFDNWNKEKK